MQTMPSTMIQWKELARILEGEWRGQSIDSQRARDLADVLLPQFPELRNTLTHIQARLGRVTH
jgi:hypothetical protein